MASRELKARIQRNPRVGITCCFRTGYRITDDTTAKRENVYTCVSVISNTKMGRRGVLLKLLGTIALRCLSPGDVASDTM